MRKRPGQVARDDGVEAFRRELRVFRVHHEKINRGVDRIRKGFRPGNHFSGQIDARDHMAFGGENTGQKARARADV